MVHLDIRDWLFFRKLMKICEKISNKVASYHAGFMKKSKGEPEFFVWHSKVSTVRNSELVYLGA